jgi:hypothetical protein
MPGHKHYTKRQPEHHLVRRSGGLTPAGCRQPEKSIKDFCSDVKETVSKLIVLKRSWIVSRSEDSAENIIWFEGAESIISEVIDQLQKAQQKTESQTATASAAASTESDDSASSDTAEDSETEAAAEENEANDDSEEAEKQAAAG